MRVLCRHGHISFYPRREYEVYIFNEMFDVELERVSDFYTFPLLASAPDFSLIGKTYLGLPAIARYEGMPWEIMKENGFVYNISLETLVPKLTVVSSINPVIVGQYSIINGPIIQPGSINYLGQKIMSYDAEYLQDSQQLRILEYSYE